MQYSGERSEGRTKYEYAQQLAASLAYLMLGQQDGVGLVTFDDEPREWLPSRSRPSHLRAVLQAIAENGTKRETDLGGVFQRIAPKLSRRGLLVILSDGMGDVDSLAKAFALFRSARHEILFFQVLDPDEIDFPFSGRIQFRDLESSQNEQMVDAKSIRDAYLRRYEEYQNKLRNICRKQRVDLVQMTTDRPFADALHEYLSVRRRGR